ncbi:hypothetical protein ABIE78_000316 [Sinorhizobium fredii]
MDLRIETVELGGFANDKINENLEAAHRLVIAGFKRKL